MADEKHLEILRQGVEAWNRWRNDSEDLRRAQTVADRVRPNLNGADLSKANLSKADFAGVDFIGAKLIGANLSKAVFNGADLSEADLSKADFAGVNLTGAKLIRANLSKAVFSGADLSYTDLSGADLARADLAGAHLNGANLQSANLSKADLAGADFSAVILGRLDIDDQKFSWPMTWAARLVEANLSGANLLHANLSRADLNRAQLSKARLGWTVFVDVDLSEAKGLDKVIHDGPSGMGIDTIYRSQGKIPEIFLRGAGVPDEFITYVASLVGQPIQFYSCFISYSSKDQAFAERLYADLQSNNVRCWFAPEDLKIGDPFRQRIEESIRVYDKLLVVLSKNSVNSSWVATEVEAALEKERKPPGRTVLFPVRLDNEVMDTCEAWAADIRRTRHIGDFTHWKEHEAYQRTFARLLRDLKAKLSDKYHTKTPVSKTGSR